MEADVVTFCYLKVSVIYENETGIQERAKKSEGNSSFIGIGRE